MLVLYCRHEKLSQSPKNCSFWSGHLSLASKMSLHKNAHIYSNACLQADPNNSFDLYSQLVYAGWIYNLPVLVVFDKLSLLSLACTLASFLATTINMVIAKKLTLTFCYIKIAFMHSDTGINKALFCVICLVPDIHDIWQCNWILEEYNEKLTFSLDLYKVSQGQSHGLGVQTAQCLSSCGSRDGCSIQLGIVGHLCWVLGTGKSTHAHHLQENGDVIKPWVIWEKNVLPQFILIKHIIWQDLTQNPNSLSLCRAKD